MWMCFWITKFHTIFIRKFSFSVSIFEIYLWTKMTKFFLAKCFVSSFRRCRFNVRKATLLFHRLSYSHILPPLCLPPFPLYELDLRYIIIRTDIVWQVLSLFLSLLTFLFLRRHSIEPLWSGALEPFHAVPCAMSQEKKPGLSTIYESGKREQK